LPATKFTYGVALFQHGYLQQAEESFLEVVTAKPDDPDAYSIWARSACARTIFPRRVIISSGFEAAPNYPEAWNNLGMMPPRKDARTMPSGLPAVARTAAALTPSRC